MEGGPVSIEQLGAMTRHLSVEILKNSRSHTTLLVGAVIGDVGIRGHDSILSEYPRPHGFVTQDLGRTIVDHRGTKLLLTTDEPLWSLSRVPSMIHR